MAIVGRFYDFLLADSHIYTTLFHEREASGQYWLPSYITVWEQHWLSTLKRKSDTGGTEPIVPVGVHADICAVPSCDEVRAVVLASQLDGVFGVGFGRSALGTSCSEQGGGASFDMEGYEELVRTLGSAARQEIDRPDSQEVQQAGKAVHRNRQGNIAGGDETR